MIADVRIDEKSFGDKSLLKGAKFSIDDGEKVGVVGRNGVGKSTLFGILSGEDKDFSGEIKYRRGVTIVSTAQEHHRQADVSVVAYILSGLPEYTELKKIIDELPSTMGDDLKLIEKYTEALERFDSKGFYQIEERIERELANFQLVNVSNRALSSLSGGQKRLIEIVKIMHSDAHLALLDEPTNHMDYVAKAQFIDWIKNEPKQSMLIITHDRDVLRQVDRIIEIKNEITVSYKGNYDDYLKQNTVSTASSMNEFEHVEKRISNLKQKVVEYQRLKERARNPQTIQNFKRLELGARAELAELSQLDKPSFWIDRESIADLDYKTATRYDKFKARNIRVGLKDSESRSKRVLVKALDLSLGYKDKILFEGVNIDLREGEAIELRGRNGAGKTTLIKALLGIDANINKFDGMIELAPSTRVGVYEQEIEQEFLADTLMEAIEKAYLRQNLPISQTKIRQLASDYLFVESDLASPLDRLSGGQKARFQLIKMLSNNPELLILDEPTNHLDLPSIEELESALQRFSGAILYVSHDGYFREKINGTVVSVGVN